MNAPTNQTEALDFYRAHHIPTTPVKPNEKSGRLPRWSIPGTVVLPSDFKPGDNVGALNGAEVEPGWFFHDIDIDITDPIARRVIEDLLPRTGWRYGRPGKPQSHASYLCSAPLRTRRYSGADGKVIIELRGITQKKTYTLSVAPGSIHESGEPIRFIEPLGDLGRVQDAAAFSVDVQYIAVAVVIAMAWPATGRHNLRLAFAKLLLEHGVPFELAQEMLKSVMRATGSDEDDVPPTMAATRDALARGTATAGASIILETLGQGILSALARILKTGAIDDGQTVNVGELTTTMVDRAWSKVISANDPPGLFKRDGEVLVLRDCGNTCLSALYEEQLKLEEPAQLQSMSGFRKIDTETFREIVGRMVPCVEQTLKQTKTKVYPPREFASLMLASPALPLPEPTGFTPVPFFTAEGLLVTSPGLHRPTGMFYQPARGFAMPDIPERPTLAELAEAVGWLDAMVWQFPFKGRQGKHPYMDLRDGCDWRRTAAFANMMAFPLTILARSLFHAVPLFLIDKPTTRTGASLLVQCWSYVLTGAWPSEAEWDGNESERRKFLTAILITGAPIIFLDEVKDFKSPDLNKILTGKNARIGRVLGSTEITNPHNFSTFVATGNNPAFPKDMAGRMCRVRLDTSTSKPSDRHDWDKDLMTWVPEHRMELLAALYTIIRAWFAAGKPAQPEKRVLNGFEPWSEAIGGMLAHAGIAEFLANKRDVEDDAETEEEDEVEQLLEEWAAKHLGKSVTVGTLLQLPGVPTQNGATWNARQLGAWLRHNRDRRRMLGSGVEIYIVKMPTEHFWKMKRTDGISEFEKSLPSMGNIEI